MGVMKARIYEDQAREYERKAKAKYSAAKKERRKSKK